MTMPAVDICHDHTSALGGAGALTPGEEPQAIQGRQEHWHPALRPANPWESWVLGRLAAETVRLEQLEQHEQWLRTHYARRAVLLWDEDRDLAAVELAARLPRDPARVARRLRASAHGCARMIEGWTALRAALDRGGAWDETRRSRALDLLGVAPEARDGDPFGLEAASVEALREFATAQIARLTTLKEGPLAELDARERANAQQGRFADVPRPLASLRRQIAECQRRILWAHSQFREQRPPTPRDPAAAPDRPPAAPPPPPPSPPPSPSRPMDSRTAEEIRRQKELFARMARLDASPAPAGRPPLSPAPRPPAPSGGQLGLRALRALARRASV